MTARNLHIVLAAFLALAPSVACSAAQKAAREDPMKCERDPKCEQKRGRTADCSMQCSDDPACVERCEQIQAPTKLGR